MVNIAVVCIIFIACFFKSEAVKQLSITWNAELNTYSLVKGRAKEFIALGEYKNDINNTGWAYLEITTNSSHDDLDQAYTAGLAEALLTGDLIKMHMHNTLGSYCKLPFSGYCQRLNDYIVQNFAWMQKQIDAYAKTSSYWHQIEIILVQIQGLIDGYQFKQTGRNTITNLRFKPDIAGLFILQIAGDLGDFESALHGEENGKKHVVGTGSCSALVKLLPGNFDLLASQVTWNTYESMLRILKKYDLGYHLTKGSKTLVPGSVMSFSSYPGMLSSMDDFYTISSGLVAMETTIGNNNDSLWIYVKPENSVVEGIRNMVANRLATTGKEWMDIFSQFNSGTYNNQWMIVDYNKFDAGNPDLPDGLLSILEQIPGMIVAHDQTEILRKQSYWPSYNIAFYPEIFNTSGDWALVNKYGDWFTYDRAPRANIFRRDHHSVKNVDTMTHLMRYNDYTHDPLAACNCTPPYSAENGISSRNDLNPMNGTYPFGALGHRSHGGTDMKLTTSTMVKDFEFVAISGPTFDSLPPFQWSKSDFDKTVSHLGQPDLWMFKPIQHKWKK